jgi:hypothetical protein
MSRYQFRFPEGHRLAELDPSDASCVAQCECSWATVTLGEQMQQRAAYSHAQHVYAVRLNDWIQSGFRGGMPHEPDREHFLSRKYFLTIKDAA